MKYLILLVVVLLVAWLWRSNRNPPSGTAPKAASNNIHDMVRCPVCDLHLPKNDAIAGKQGVYCSEAHRQAIEGTTPRQP